MKFRPALSPESLSLHVRNIVILIEYHSGEGQEVGAWENSVWEGYKRWERKGREVGRSFKRMESGINKGKLHENAYYVAIEKWL